MSSITLPIERSPYQVMMEPPKDSQRISMFLHTLRESALDQGDPTKRFFTTTGYAVLILATAFFETLKFTGICLQTCIIDIWYLDFDEVKENLKNASENTVQCGKYVIAMPFILFAGMFSPEKVYSPLDYPFVEANAPRLELERITQEKEVESLRAEAAEEQVEYLQETLDGERVFFDAEIETERQKANVAEEQVQNLQRTIDDERVNYLVEIGREVQKARRDEVAKNARISDRVTDQLKRMLENTRNRNDELNAQIIEKDKRISDLEKFQSISQPRRGTLQRTTNRRSVDANKFSSLRGRPKSGEYGPPGLSQEEEKILRDDLDVCKEWLENIKVRLREHEVEIVPE